MYIYYVLTGSVLGDWDNYLQCFKPDIKGCFVHGVCEARKVNKHLLNNVLT